MNQFIIFGCKIVMTAALIFSYIAIIGSISLAVAFAWAGIWDKL